MTCIVGIEHNNKVYMGSDSCVTTDTCKTMLAHSKLIQKNQIIFGYAGSPRFSDILKYHMEFPKHEKAMDDKDYLVSVVVKRIRKSCTEHGLINENEVLTDMALIGYKSKLYFLSSDYSIVRNLEQYGAIGSGANVAMGSLHTTKELKNVKVEERVRLALCAAADHARGVSTPFHYESI